MASASVVGQRPGPHSLDPEPQLLLFMKKISLPRKSSREKLTSRRSSGSSGESGPVTTEGAMCLSPSQASERADSPKMCGHVTI